MGKKKKCSGAQPRTKDNLKPSSSEKAAQFLVQQTGSLGLPSSFSSGSTFAISLRSALSDGSDSKNDGKITGFVPIPQDPDASNFDPRLLNILKRLDKRDPTTKQKALKDFIGLLEETEESKAVETAAVCAVLPFWPRIYSRISVDVDKRVRELAQITMTVLATRVGKELGPYVKQVLPVWSFATTDFHDIAATLADRGLSNVFPGSKRSDANRLCARQLIDFFLTKLDDVLCEPPSPIAPDVAKTDGGLITQVGGSKSRALVPNQSLEESESAEQQHMEKSPLVKLSAAIRFLTTVVADLSALPDDNRHLRRLRELLSPSNLWTRVAKSMGLQIKQLSSKNNRQMVNNGFLIYSSLYKLCIALCESSAWSAWMSITHEGRCLASFLCLSTIGQLGTETLSPEQFASKVGPNVVFLPPPLLFTGSSTCYGHCWEAALSCLARLPNELVWSAVDWYSLFVPQLEKLLIKVNGSHTKQVYTHLLSVLSKFPVDFERLSEEQENTLARLFIDDTLSGLESSLDLTPPGDSNSTIVVPTSVTTVARVDPGIPTAVVSGTLEAARYLIDRFLSVACLQCDHDAKPNPLVGRIFHEVVIRLLADALDVVSADGNVTTKFVHSRAPLYRQGYLAVVFSQVARFSVHLALSGNPVKQEICKQISAQLFQWISAEPPHSEQNVGDQEENFRLGLLDPLRFMSFIELLAEVDRSKKSSSAAPGSGDLSGSGADACSSSAGGLLLTVQSDWCVDLFRKLAELLLDKIHADLSMNHTTMASFAYVAYLCLYDRLPAEHSPTIRSFSHILFNTIFAGLPRDVHQICWPSAAVEGVCKAWDRSVDEPLETNLPPYAVCLDFLTNLLPGLLKLLPNGFKVLPQRLTTMLCQWVQKWIEKLLSSDPVCEADRCAPSVLSCIYALVLSLDPSSVSSNAPVQQLRKKIVRTFHLNLASFFPKTECDILGALPVGRLRLMGIVFVILLETVGCKNKASADECMSDLFQRFIKISFALYSVEHFSHIASFLDPASELALYSKQVNPTEDPSTELESSGLHHLFSMHELIEHTKELTLKSLSTDSTDEVVTKYFRLLFTHITHTSYVPPKLFGFVACVWDTLTARSAVISTIAKLWLSELMDHVKLVAKALTIHHQSGDSFCQVPRHLLPSLGLCPMSITDCLGKLVRLHQFGVGLGVHHRLSSDVASWRHYLQCLGLVRVWVCSLPEPWDPCTEFGWPSELNVNESPPVGRSDENTEVTKYHLEPAKAAFGNAAALLSSNLGTLWHACVLDRKLPELIDLLNSESISMDLLCSDESYNQILGSSSNALLLNRLRSVHSNLWPSELRCFASCEDSRVSGCSWSDEHLRPRIEQKSGASVTEFHRLCELYLPAGIIRRCLRRQELLGRLKSFSLASITEEAGDPTLYQEQAEMAARVLELISSLATVRTVVPVYVTAFMSIVFADYQNWLVQISESEEGRPKVECSPAAFHATLATMCFFEVLLLFWQPWQWFSGTVDKSPISNHIGLIQLSQRLRQLRPSLSRAQWDFMLCLTISWICVAVELLRSNPGARSELFAFRAFRVAAAMSSIFIRRTCVPMKFSTLMMLTPTHQRKESNVDEWNEDLDAVSDALEGKDTQTSDNDEEEEYDDPDGQSQGAPKLDDIDELEEDTAASQEGDDQEAEDGALVDFSEELLPKRGRPAASICTDWDNFFAKHLYSSILPDLLNQCLTSQSTSHKAELDTHAHIQALCAAFAACSSHQLVQILTDNPQLVLEYLVDLDVMTARSTPPSQIIAVSSTSVNDFAPGFRAGLNLACKLMFKSSYQSCQLLGHILMSRLICTTAKRTDSSDKTVQMSNYLIHRLPSQWITALRSSLPAKLENDIMSERAVQSWGRGSFCLSYFTTYSPSGGWKLDTVAHQSVLGYLLAWESLLNLLCCVGPQARARLQHALLGSSRDVFDRFMLCIGLLLPPPGNLEEFVSKPSRLEPDERLLLPVSSTRTDLIAALSLCSTMKEHYRRPIRLANPLASGDDRNWRDPFAPDDRLLYLPGHRLGCDINHLAVRLLRRFLAEAPALVRSWFNLITSTPIVSAPNEMEESTPKSSPLSLHRSGRLRQLGNQFEKLVTQHFSSGLARDEVVLVQYKARLRQFRKDKKSSKSWFSGLTSSPAPEVGSVKIRSRPLSREVIATYQVTDDQSMEMLIQLPQNYPLGLASVSCERGIGVSTQQWHLWTIQLSVFINNQNGSILDGIDLWQQNVRKKFEGVEECAICYSVVHSTNFSLPKMQCHTCHKYFHYACMYRWFTTSRNPSCPLCRQMFFNPAGRPV
ncbi:unnamed protein product [Calicophoron daubneyi]|uniref:E3 ubiquitin-protein ligase listerin n=1 Tax=Calicophoron daubneyi TaxID=300641 RepID=A0AAV2TCN4_CALDB